MTLDAPARSAPSGARSDPTAGSGWKGVRVKEVRHETLRPGGRAELTLFAAGEDGGRPHPRLRATLPPVADPFTGPMLSDAAGPPPHTAAGFASWLNTAWDDAARSTVSDIDMEDAPTESRQYYRNSIRTQRTARFFAECRALLNAHVRPEDQVAARAALRSLEDRAYAGHIRYDDADTGTYHSYGQDAPFVHYLETVLSSLPKDGGTAMALLPPEQQESIRRQRNQARAHLDHLMRHKYAHDGVVEVDIEPQIGARLIDRHTRHVVSETPETRGEARPAYELLQIVPMCAHPHAGAWLHRSPEGLHLSDGTRVEADPQNLRRVPISADRLTFQRVTDRSLLRSGVRVDWDGNGWLSPETIGWVSWAGHCDIKAVMEQLGITLTGTESDASVTEYRSDTGETTVFSRDLLVEMIASAMELGSVYVRADGSGMLRRGRTRFGGARNDCRPDRLQLTGTAPGRSLRWPLSLRTDTLVVRSIERDGEKLDLDRVFHRWIPMDGVLDFEANPLFLKTIEGDCSLLDVSGCRLAMDVLEDAFDEHGYPTRRPIEVTIDLRAGASEASARVYLGAQLHDAAARTVWKVWLDLERAQVEAEVFEWVRDGQGPWTERKREGQGVTLPLQQPLAVTLSRETKRDDPAMFRTLLETALRTGQNICADTDMASEVWNGVVTSIEAECLSCDLDRRVEHWRVQLVARFGSATLEYLLRRDAGGDPEAWCPIRGENDADPQPDFLWQDFPDVASKARVNGEWVVNKAMLDRGIISVEARPDLLGGFYVYDDHIKNIFELLHCGLSGRNFTLVHGNKRWCFAEKSEWEAHCVAVQGGRDRHPDSGERTAQT